MLANHCFGHNINHFLGSLVALGNFGAEFSRIARES